MIRGGTFEFLKNLLLLRSSLELSTPVTVSLRDLVVASPTALDVCTPLDWWIHTGGYLRDQFERKFQAESQGARTVQLEILMRPDPVVVFEIATWLERTLDPLVSDRAQSIPIAICLSTRAGFRQEWTSALPRLGLLGWKNGDGESAKIHDVSQNLKLVGLDDLVSTALGTEFLNEMNFQLGIDILEPPWIFWSRLPGWLKHKKQMSDVSEIELRLSLIRSCLSPQDEKSELESLTAGDIMLNPTFETVGISSSRGHASPLMARSRFGDQMTSRPLTALEALVLDEVRESFRSPRDNVVRDVAQSSGVQKEFVDRTIDSLRRDSFLLCGE